MGAVVASILVIDDAPDVLEVFRAILESKGHAVVEALDGKRGLALYRQEPFDLVITDIFMPEISGFEVLSTIKRTCPDQKIIATSALEDVLEQAQKYGADALLLKPFGVWALVEVVREVLGGEGHSSSKF